MHEDVVKYFFKDFDCGDIYFIRQAFPRGTYSDLYANFHEYYSRARRSFLRVCEMMTTTMIALSVKLTGFRCHDDTSMRFCVRILSLLPKEYASNVLVSFCDVIPECQLENVNRFHGWNRPANCWGKDPKIKKYRLTLTITSNLLKFIKNLFSYFNLRFLLSKIFISKTHFIKFLLLFLLVDF